MFLPPLQLDTPGDIRYTVCTGRTASVDYVMIAVCFGCECFEILNTFRDCLLYDSRQSFCLFFLFFFAWQRL